MLLSIALISTGFTRPQIQNTPSSLQPKTAVALRRAQGAGAGAGAAPAAKPITLARKFAVGEKLSYVVKPITLARKFAVGEKLSYVVKTNYTEEQRSGELMTFFPSDQGATYPFSLEVKKLLADGFAEAVYSRPTFTSIIGDTVESGPVSKTEKLNQVYKMTISPINEITDAIDISPKKGAKLAVRARAARQDATGITASIIGSFVGEIARLSFFIGGFESSLDLAPRLPLEPVKPGDTWKRTVGYSPQRLKGEGTKSAPQRLDYVYTYVGPTTLNGKKVQRIKANLSLKTDLAEFAKQISSQYGETIITKAPTTLDAEIIFDLDAATGYTLRAVANSKNSFAIYLKGVSTPIQENRAKGTTTLTLLKRTVPATKPKG